MERVFLVEREFSHMTGGVENLYLRGKMYNFADAGEDMIQFWIDNGLIKDPMGPIDVILPSGVEFTPGPPFDDAAALEAAKAKLAAGKTTSTVIPGNETVTVSSETVSTSNSGPILLDGKDPKTVDLTKISLGKLQNFAKPYLKKEEFTAALKLKKEDMIVEVKKIIDSLK